MYRFMFSIQNINNAALLASKAMPQKDSTSDNTSSFEMGRQTYINTYPTVTMTTQQKINKKWYGNKDASQVTSNRRNTEIGVGSLNASKNLMSFTTYKDINTTNDALRRVRAGGSVAPPKKNANTKNAPTPTFKPAVPANDVIGIKYPVLNH